MWTPAEKALFLSKSFEMMHGNNRASRDRILATVRHVVTLILAIGLFLITRDSPPANEIYVLSAAGIILVATMAILILSKSYRNIQDCNQILAELETTMEFHKVGGYNRSEAPLYPKVAALKHLKKGAHGRLTNHLYLALILLAALFSLLALYASWHQAQAAPLSPIVIPCGRNPP